VPGVIRHFFHGAKVNRKYRERWTILVENRFNPCTHLEQKDGLLVPSTQCPPKLLEDIVQYFKERNEDDQ